MASRKHPPDQFEHRLWRAASAWNSFQYVRDACDYILREQVQSEDSIFYPLVTAICVLYARPFKGSTGIKRLSTQFVPNKFHHLHEQLISVRDETAAHVDTRGHLFEGLPANNIRLIVRDGQVRLEVRQVKFKITTISQIRDLASDLVKRMDEHVAKLESEYPNEIPEEGEYLIDPKTGIRRLQSIS